MMSGSRKEPPSSISSPRDTITSLRFARALSSSTTAAALLFTTAAAGAPVSRHSQGAMWSSRSPRSPRSRSYSRLEAPSATCRIASMASGGKGARPRLVCSTVPVRLKTGRREGRIRAATRRRTAVAMASLGSLSGGVVLVEVVARRSASSSRIASRTTVRPCCSIRSASLSCPNRRSTEGRWTRGATRGGLSSGRAGMGRLYGWEKGWLRGDGCVKPRGRSGPRCESTVLPVQVPLGDRPVRHYTGSSPSNDPRPRHRRPP